MNEIECTVTVIAVTVIADGSGGHIASDMVKDRWVLPPSFLRQELRVSSHDLQIIEVLGDSMEPTLRSGARVLIHTSHRRPSPPGVYAIWDGFGVVLKRIEVVPHTDPPRLRLISDNPRHAPYEASLDDARIIGRVVCKVESM